MHSLFKISSVVRTINKATILDFSHLVAKRSLYSCLHIKIELPSSSISSLFMKLCNLRIKLSMFTPKI